MCKTDSSKWACLANASKMFATLKHRSRSPVRPGNSQRRRRNSSSSSSSTGSKQSTSRRPRSPSMTAKKLIFLFANSARKNKLKCLFQFCFSSKAIHYCRHHDTQHIGFICDIQHCHYAGCRRSALLSRSQIS